MSPRDATHGVSFRAALRVWLTVGLNSFGGPAGQIAVMHRMLVEERRWIGEARFLHALNYCMLLPGPEATQLATYVGWLMHRWPGGVAAGLLFVLPGAVTMLVLAGLYAVLSSVGFAAAVFYGLKAAVLAVVLEAMLRIGRRALKTPFLVALAAFAFIALFLFDLPFPLVIVIAALAGLAVGQWRPDWLPAGNAHGASAGQAAEDSLLGETLPAHARASLAGALRTLALWLAIWFAPLAPLALVFGGDSIFIDLMLFFSKMAVVTFGGAYAVLAYVAQQAVEHYGWLSPGQMLDGLALAETTPGPLILVLEFVGFLAAYQAPEGLPPLAAGALAAAVTIWATFAPCFLWIFLGAPFIEKVRQSRVLASALAAITAAVVGVILNLTVWFALHVLFAEINERQLGPLRLLVPDPRTLDLGAAALAVLALVLMFRFHQGMLRTLAICGLIGLALAAL